MKKAVLLLLLVTLGRVGLRPGDANRPGADDRHATHGDATRSRTQPAQHQ